MPGVPVVIKGEMYRSDVEVGGDPIVPIDPPGTWGGSGEPFPGYGLPGHPPGTWGGSGEGFPTYPIVIPPDFIAPGYPEHPIVIPPPPSIWPGRPTHPIVIPPDLGIWPDDGKPAHPIVIPPPTSVWPPVPRHPIVLPPGDSTPEPDPKWQVKAYWTEQGGWAVAIVPTEGATVPTPSSGS